MLKAQFKQPKKITLEDLARMVANGFKESKEDLSNAVDGLDKKLTRRIDSLEQKMNTKFEEVFDRFDNTYLRHPTRREHNQLKERVAKIESGLDTNEQN